jgi:dTDP-4-dehydrorhamnose reductase
VKVLVFGGTGQVGTELRRHPDVIAPERHEADLSDAEACAALIAQTDAAAVINAAAYTAVDRAEEEERLATAINGEAPAAMARSAAARGLPFVHLSSDYVFDGSGATARTPDMPTAPVNAYGRSKRAGEQGTRAARGTHVILRTSWVFSAHGTNFVKTMLRIGVERPSLNVVADQIGGPTPASAIAEACLLIVDRLMTEPRLSGTYHFAGAPDVSWAGFARAILERAGLGCTVTDIATSDYPTLAPRPLNSRLDCRTTEAAFGLARPDWRAELDGILAELEAA